MARLISNKNEEDADRARAEIAEILSSSNISAEWLKREPLNKISDNKVFNKWNAKTLDKEYGNYRKKLINRVPSSNKLTNSTEELINIRVF